MEESDKTSNDALWRRRRRSTQDVKLFDNRWVLAFSRNRGEQNDKYPLEAGYLIVGRACERERSQFLNVRSFFRIGMSGMGHLRFHPTPNSKDERMREKVSNVIINNLLYSGCRHSSVDSSVPTILPPQVWVPSTPSTLFCTIMSLCWEKDENKQKMPALVDFFKKNRCFCLISLFVGGM